MRIGWAADSLVSDAAAFRVTVAPLASWLWLGCWLLVAGAVALAMTLSGAVRSVTQRDVADDVYAASRARDLRLAVELFERERGEFPRQLEDLTDDRWIEPGELIVPGYAVEYKVRDRGTKYELKLTPDR